MARGLVYMMFIGVVFYAFMTLSQNAFQFKGSIEVSLQKQDNTISTIFDKGNDYRTVSYR